MESILSFFIFALGLCIGSFLNVVILRLEKSESLGGRSHCPHCQHSLAWHDLIPVFSFIFLDGKCRYCHAKISIQYPVVELSTALMFLLIFNFQQFGPELTAEGFPIFNTIFLFYIASSLIVIFVYDLRHYLIPDVILFPAIGIILAYRFIDNWKLILDNYGPAALLASGFFLAIFLISRGRWLGFGDVKLAILMGLLLGWPNILVALLLSFWLGAIIGLAVIFLQKKGLKSELPFAPFLIAGTFMALFWGAPIVAWYSGFLLF